MAQRFGTGICRGFGHGSLPMSAAKAHCPRLAPTSRVPAHPIPSPRLASSSASPNAPSSPPDRPTLASLSPTIVKDPLSYRVRRTVLLTAPHPTTRAEVVQSIARTAPVGRIASIKYYERPYAGKDPSTVNIAVTFAREASARQLLESARRRGPAFASRFLLNGRPALVRPHPLKYDYYDEEEPPLGRGLSRVVLVCAPSGRLPPEQAVRQALPREYTLTKEVQVDVPWETETSPVLSYQVPGVPELQVMEWRFLSRHVAGSFAHHVQQHPAARNVLGEEVYFCFGMDPCSGGFTEAVNRQLAREALTDLGKRAPLSLKGAADGLVPQWWKDVKSQMRGVRRLQRDI